ncbi:protoporphyrinogen oxidase [Lentisphaera profundi]|uniref:Coproporphyrinogen III oxidase n=1 Tax=Lentisphaera profundi TaxID=1658616 RepID=A0ABY7VXW1_9BACT|nr:protoporphyrinogen oxidase [Lentisphaera profundi]WDE98761.1 protoporphyrinogen oxidase [Lentisphaera profundi]
MSQLTRKVAVVGAGLSGLATAYFLGKQLSDVEITVFEEEAVPGGKILSDQKAEFPHEKGPNGFLSSRREIFELCEELELDILFANEDAAKRYLWMDGELKRIPEGPVSMMTWGELSLKTKLSLFGDILKKPRAADDESLYDFVSQQFSEEFAMKIADPFVAGVFAADPKKLSMRSAFPAVFDAQRSHGSVIKGMKAAYKSKIEQGLAPAKRKRGRLCSLRGGMKSLPKALSERVKVRYNTEVTTLNVEDETPVLCFDGQQHEFDAVVFATPADRTSEMMAATMPGLAENLVNVPYTAVGVAVCGFRETLDIPRGFGFLVPSHEKSRVLGVLFSSQIFPDNHGEGTTFRVMYGGAREPGLLDLDKDELQAIIASELKEKLGVTVPMDFFQTIPWKKAIPMYELGHYKKVEYIENALREKSIFITGTSLYGVSMNDCIVSGQNCAEQVKNYLRSKYD